MSYHFKASFKLTVKKHTKQLQYAAFAVKENLYKGPFPINLISVAYGWHIILTQFTICVFIMKNA